MDKISIEQVEELYEFLQGELPIGISCKPPHLSQRKAFTIIWFFQERLRIIPDIFERCVHCGEIFDSSKEGGQYNKRNYCDYCIVKIKK